MSLNSAPRPSRSYVAGLMCAAVLSFAESAGSSGGAFAQQRTEPPVAQQPPAVQPSDQLPAQEPVAPPSRAALARGEELLTRHCASCHAVGRTGASPHDTAPVFRTLSQRYKIEALEEALAEGLSSGHPDMPEFSFETDDVAAIIAYLNAIQEK
ncbi:MAG TPA: cytochrome c [Xanthobacteraceae bacterium]|jgi:cytochrome c